MADPVTRPVRARCGPGSTPDRRLAIIPLVPLFMDIHYRVAGLTSKAVADAHLRDLAVQAKYGVSYRSYWYDEASGRVFCLFDGPTPGAGEACHREAHGLLADEITQVQEGL